MSKRAKRLLRAAGTFALAFVLVATQVPTMGFQLAVADDQDVTQIEQSADQGKSSDSGKSESAPEATQPQAPATAPEDNAGNTDKSDKAENSSNDQQAAADDESEGTVDEEATEGEDEPSLEVESDTPEEKKGSVEGVDSVNLNSNPAWVKSIRFEVKRNGAWVPVENLPAGTTVDENTEIKVKAEFAPDIDINNGATLTYTLPNEIVIAAEATGPTKNDGGETIGNYKITKATPSQIIFTLTDTVFPEDDGAGQLDGLNITFTGKYHKVTNPGDNTDVIQFGNIKIDVPVKPEQENTKANLTVTKTTNNSGKVVYNNGNPYVQYTIKVKANNDNGKVVENVTVKDVFDQASLAYVNKSGITATANAGTFNKDTMTWEGIGNLSAGQEKTLTLTVPLTAAIMDGSAHVLNNTATAYSNNDQKGSATAKAETKAALNIQKTNSGYNNGYVEYTIKVTAPSDNSSIIKNANVKDYFTNDVKQYVTGYTFVEKTNGTKTPTFTNPNNGGTWEIGDMAPGATATLKYKIAVSDDAFVGNGSNVSRDLNNKAEVYSGTSKKADTTNAVNFWKHYVWKQGGTWDSVNKKMHFALHINESKTSSTESKDTNTAPLFPGKTITITDQLSNNNWVYVGNVTIYKYAQGPNNKGNVIETITKTPAENSSSFSYDVPGGYYYEVEYDVAPKPGVIVIGNPNVSNTAGVGISGENSTISHSYTAQGTASFDASVNKKAMSRSGNIETWQSNITSPISTGSYYLDKASTESGYKSHSMTADQRAAIKVTYKGQDITSDCTIATASGALFKVTFNKDYLDVSANNPITIDYDTTLNISGVGAGGTAKYKNLAELHVGQYSASTQAECTFVSDLKFTKTADTYNKDTQTLTWKLRMNQTGSIEGTATITENVPEGTILTDVKYNNVKGEKAAVPTISTPVDNGDGTYTFEVGNLKRTTSDEDATKYYVELLVSTKVVDEDFLKQNGSKKFNNEATIDVDGTTMSDSAEQTITNKAIDKIGQYSGDTAPNILYTITVNANGVDLQPDPGKTKITIEDKMGVGLLLVSSTLKVTGSKSGVIPTESLNVEVTGDETTGQTIKMTVPDDEVLTVSYEAFVNADLGDKVTVSNTASFQGIAESTKETHEEITVTESNSSGNAKVGFNVIKVNGDTFETIEGAEFTLYEVNTSTNPATVTELETLTTGKNGKVTFNNKKAGLDKNKIYAWAETKAPEGYQLEDKNAAYHFVAFTKKAIENAQADGYNTSNVRRIQPGITFEVQDFKGHIEVTKEFGKGDIASGNYYFGLFDENGALANLAPTDNPVSIYVSNLDGAKIPTATFKNVPLGKTYTVYETDAQGNKLAENNDGTIIVNGLRYTAEGNGSEATVTENKPSASVTITNTEKKPSVRFTDSKTMNKAPMKVFGFTLEGSGESQAKSNNDNGVVTFDEIAYSKTGEYTYTVAEIPGNVDENGYEAATGITYDTTKHTVVVTVAQNDTNGKFIESVTCDGTAITGTDGVYDLSSKAAFVNEFNGGFEVTKVIEGTEAELAGAVYELHKVADGIDSKLGDEYTTDEDGKISETGLEAGDYYLVETKAPKGFTLDPTHHNFKLGYGASDNEVVTYEGTVTDKAIDLKVNKTDVTGKTEIAGATIELKDAAGALIDTWVSAKGETAQFGDLVEVGKSYTLVETNAPTGYKYSADVQFSIENDGTIVSRNLVDGVVCVFDEPIAAHAVKVDADGKVVEGATIELRAAGDVKDKAGNTIYDDGEVIATWTSKKGETFEFGDKLVVNNNYTLVETKAPKGYGIAAPVNFTVAADGTIAGAEVVDDNCLELKVVDDSIDLKVNKTDVTGKTEIAGATIELKDADGKTIASWTSKANETADFGEYVEAGKSYTLVETNAPTGYKYASDVQFSIAEDGTVNCTAMVDGVILMKDEPIAAHAIKVDENGAAVEGAVIELRADGAATDKAGNTIYADGEVIATWTSKKGETFEFGDKLVVNNSYTLVETYAPKGFGYAEDVNFTVDPRGNIDGAATNADGCFEMVVSDKAIDLHVTKTDITGEDEVAGATIQLVAVEDVVAVDGTVVYKADEVISDWVSDGRNVDFGQYLLPGSYKLVEANAPTGYAYAEDMPFTIAQNGDVVSDEYADGTIKVMDEALKLEANKVDFDGVEVAGATLTLRANGDVQDKAGKTIYTDGQDIISWTSVEGETFDYGSYLVAGGSFVIVETEAPVGFGYAKPAEFSVAYDGTITVVENDTTVVNSDEDGVVIGLAAQDKRIELHVNKTDLGGEEVEGATISIFNASDIDEDGNVIDGAEPVDKWVSVAGETHDFGPAVYAEDENHSGEYVMVETNAPTGYAYAEIVPFKIENDGTVLVNGEEADSAVLIDEAFVMPLNKVDVNGKEINGAQLTLIAVSDTYDKEGHLIYSAGEKIVSWTSKKGETFDYGKYLVAGGEFMIKETKVPDGYIVAEDIIFTVDDYGNIDITAGGDFEYAKDGSIVVNMVDGIVAPDDDGPQTGDSTDMGLLALLAALMAAALAGFAVTTRLKRRED